MCIFQHVLRGLSLLAVVIQQFVCSLHVCCGMAAPRCSNGDAVTVNTLVRIPQGAPRCAIKPAMACPAARPLSSAPCALDSMQKSPQAASAAPSSTRQRSGTRFALKPPPQRCACMYTGCGAAVPPGRQSSQRKSAHDADHTLMPFSNSALTGNLNAAPSTCRRIARHL